MMILIRERRRRVQRSEARLFDKVRKTRGGWRSRGHGVGMEEWHGDGIVPRWGAEGARRHG